MAGAIMAGNWKMNLTSASGVELAAAIARAATDHPAVRVILAPPFTLLPAVSATVSGTAVAVAAQDTHWAESGPFTGAVSPSMVREYASHVIVGHSERRALFGETDDDVNRKVHAALDHGLAPIVCVGETEAQRDAGATDQVVARQLDAACDGVRDREAASLLVAYEPVWAIGTGRSCPPDEAGRVAGLLRGLCAARFGAAAPDVPVLYGGSMAPANAAALLAQGEISGGLVGGASLDAAAFGTLVCLAAAKAPATT